VATQRGQRIVRGIVLMRFGLIIFLINAPERMGMGQEAYIASNTLKKLSTMNPEWDMQ